MIDFLKLLVLDKSLIDRIYSDKRLIIYRREEYLSSIYEDEILTKETKQYKGVLFNKYENKLEILIKPHYLFNDYKHNANDFSVLNCIFLLGGFIDDLNIRDEVEKLQVINIEFGVNAVSPMDLKDLITFAKYYGKNELVNDIGLRYSKKGFTPDKNGKYSKYKMVKFYAKHFQFPTFSQPNTFRFEVRSKKSKFINKLGIFNLSDLLRIDTIMY